jgi:16S rRNA A1518/A1519 N6-dimethyltransferase RsmA/KsgA/DIM1 with predicted DNA glycosylase/AP lyase activity
MLFWLFIILVSLFGFVLLFGAPYLPTTKRQVRASFELLELKEGQTFLELGSGDGRLLLAGAKQGLRCVGYELNPLLVIVSIIVTWRYRKQVTIHWGNFWNGDLAEADGIFVFLLDRYMEKLDKKVQSECAQGTKLVSFGFKIPHRKVARTEHGVRLYIY